MPLGDEPLRKRCPPRNSNTPYSVNRRLRDRLQRLEEHRRRTEHEEALNRKVLPTFMRNGDLVANPDSPEVLAILKLKKNCGASYLWLNKHGEIATLLPSKHAFSQVPCVRQETGAEVTYMIEMDFMAATRYEGSQLVRDITTMAKVRPSLPMTSTEHSLVEYLCVVLDHPFPRILDAPINELLNPAANDFKNYDDFHSLWTRIANLLEETRLWIRIFIKKLILSPEADVIKPDLIQLNINGARHEIYLENGLLDNFLLETPSCLEDFRDKGEPGSWKRFKRVYGSNICPGPLLSAVQVAAEQMASSSGSGIPHSPPFSAPASRSPSYHVRSPTPGRYDGQSSSSGEKSGET